MFGIFVPQYGSASGLKLDIAWLVFAVQALAVTGGSSVGRSLLREDVRYFRSSVPSLRAAKVFFLI